MKDLIERLRNYEDGKATRLEAADELEKLTAERDVLRTAAKLGLDALVSMNAKYLPNAILALRGVLKGEKE